jgi:putative DNA primase/helicase
LDYATTPPPEPISAGGLLLAEVPPRPAILAPLLQKGGLCLLYGPRGIGKTYVALSMAWAAASGSSFLGWHAEKPRRVVYVNGEMAAADMKKRVAALGPPPDSLSFILNDISGERFLPDLAEFAGIETLWKACGKHWPDLLVLDNLSSLAGYHRNNPDPWMMMQRFFLMLRRVGTAVIIVHHANKDGGQRGSSNKEDVLDLVLALRQPRDYRQSEGARFELHVEKARGICGAAVEPIEARLGFLPDGQIHWEWSPLERQDLDRVMALLRQGLNPNQIARELGISKSKAYRLRDQAEAECFSALQTQGDQTP